MVPVNFEGDPEYIDPTVVFAERAMAYTWEGGHYVRKPENFGIVVGKGVFIGANSVVVRGSWRDTRIGEGTKIGNLCNIGHNVIIGKHCLISPGVLIGGSCEIGDNVKMGQGAVIRQHIKIGPGVHIKTGQVVTHNILTQDRPKIGRNFQHGQHCVIEDGVAIGDNVTFKHYVEIREGCKIGNNVRFGSRITLAAGTIIEDDVIIKYSTVTTDTKNLNSPDAKKPCVIRQGTRIGAHVTIMPGVTIGKNCRIGLGATIYEDLPDGTVVKNRA